jgi:hypothetical protein
MALFVNNRQSQGVNRPFNNFPPDPIVLNRAPTSNDIGSDLGQLWVQNVDSNGNPVNGVWVLTNPTVWTPLETSGSGGVFSSLTVTPGPISLTGTTSINTSGAGVTSIGVGGTGAVHIGNSTGNTNIAAGNFTVTSGNVSVPAGSVSAGLSITATNALTGGTVYASGDLGGVASQNSLTNVVATAAGGGTVTFAANGAGNITQTGWMKMYVGTTAVYIPYFSSIA